jgi:hypothetical protein
MAKKRRSYQINSGDYNVAGGGGGASSGNVRYMQKSTTAVAAGGTGVLYTPGTKQVPNPLKFVAEAGLAFTSANSVNSRVYFEHAFEAPSAQVALVGSNQTDELPTGYSGNVPAGMTFNDNQDQGDGNYGYVQIATSTLSSGGTPGTYKFRYSIDQGGWTRSYIDYEIEVFPSGTTPVQANAGILTDKIVQNIAGIQYLSDTLTGSQIVGYTLKDLSGFTTGVTPKIDATNGKVYVENVGTTGVIVASSHSFTVEVDIGQYGKVDYVYTGNIGYGDPYGARYFGPANANVNITSTTSYSLADSKTVCTPNKSSGALRRVYNARADTSPYVNNDGYGCEAITYPMDYNTQAYQNTMGQYSKFGYMGHSPTASRFWSSTSNHNVAKFLWQVPAGVSSVCVVCVGGGSHGAYNWSADGGGGAGLAWMNGITVTPGEIFRVGVGLGRYSVASHGSEGGGPSYFCRQNSNGSVGMTLLYAQGGGWHGYTNGNPSSQNTSYHGGHSVTGITTWQCPSYNFNNSRDGGGWGVRQSEGSAVNGFIYGGGSGAYSGDRFGAGAGGYRGNMGGQSSSEAGQFGGGGSGYDYSSTHGYGAGGGVGLDGQGNRGGRTDSNPRSAESAGSGYGGYQQNQTSYAGPSSCQYFGGGGGGSGGSRGVYGENPFTGREESNGGSRARCGGMHGGGGGGSGTTSGGGNGAPGGVRIIWGVGADGTARSFPYTYCSEKPSMKYNGE